MQEHIIDSLTIEITNRCNLLCRMCSIWKEKEKKDLSYENIKGMIYANNIFHSIRRVSITGGECFLHPDFERIANFLASLIPKKVIGSLSISTNGYDTEKITSFLSRIRVNRGKISVEVSIDGLEQSHVMQRRKDDCYEKSVTTVKKIKSMFPGTQISIKMTINKHNIKDIVPVYKFCKQTKARFLPKIIDGNNPHYYHREQKDADFVALSDENKEEIITHLSELAVVGNDDIINKEMLRQIIYNLASKEKPKCTTPMHSLFVTCEGEIYPCIYMESIGNIKDKGWESKIFSNKHSAIIESAKKGKCPGCIAYHGYLRKINFD